MFILFRSVDEAAEIDTDGRLNDGYRANRIHNETTDCGRVGKTFSNEAEPQRSNRRHFVRVMLVLRHGFSFKDEKKRTLKVFLIQKATPT